MRTINSYRHPVDRYKLGMLGAFEFEEPAADLAYDAHGANNGSVVGATVNKPGVSRGYLFQNSADNVSFAQGLVATGNNFSINLWAHPISATQTQYADIIDFGHDQDGTNQNFVLQSSSTGNQYYFPLWNGTDWGQSINCRVDLTVGVFQMVTIVKDGTTLSIYRNGSLYDQETVVDNVGWDFTKAMKFGNHVQSNGRGWKGYLDQVSFFNGVLDSAKIEELYNDSYGLKHSDWSANLKSDVLNVWELDEKTGINVVDSFGTNDGTNSGAAIGKVGAVSKLVCYEFDGVNDYVDVTSAKLTGFPFSVSMWVRMSSSQTQSTHAFMCRQTGVLNWIRLVADTSGIWYYEFYSSGSQLITTTTPIADDNWHLLTITADLSNFAIYVDGVQENSGAHTYPSGNFSALDLFYIGADSGGIEAFKGNIDQPCVWDRAITPSEIQQIYNSGTGLNYDDWSASLKTDLVSLWGFNEKASSLIAHDSHTPFQATTVSSIVPIPNRTGKVGKCFEYVTGDYMITKPDYFPVGSNKISFSLWLYCHVVPTSAYRYYEVMGANFGTSWAAPYYLWTFKIYIRSPDRNFFVWQLGDGTTSVGLSSAVNTYQANVWTHICGVWDGDYMALYKNGALMVDGTGKNAISGVNMTGANFLMGRIDGGKPSTYYGFDGLLDQIFLWDNYVLTPDQVAWLYNGGNGRTYDELT